MAQKNVEIMVPFKCLSNFWRTPEVPTFTINNAKLYVPLVT